MAVRATQYYVEVKGDEFSQEFQDFIKDFNDNNTDIEISGPGGPLGQNPTAPGWIKAIEATIAAIDKTIADEGSRLTSTELAKLSNVKSYLTGLKEGLAISNLSPAQRISLLTSIMTALGEAFSISGLLSGTILLLQGIAVVVVGFVIVEVAFRMAHTVGACGFAGLRNLFRFMANGRAGITQSNYEARMAEAQSVLSCAGYSTPAPVTQAQAEALDMDETSENLGYLADYTYRGGFAEEQVENCPDCNANPCECSFMNT